MQVNFNPVSGIPDETFDYVNKWMGNPIILFIILAIIMIYYSLFATASSVETVASSGSGGRFLEVLLWGTFLTIVLMNALRYFYGSDITAKITNILGKNPEIDVTVTAPEGEGPDVPEVSFSKQVFHVPGNKYTYNDAKAVCAAYGGKLASYNEMEDAYENGADWCSYGWSDDQMAFFPTQEAKWKKLQKIEGHKHDCGRPGINGGYIANPNVRFGVNCYGYKPDITPYESELMNSSTGIPVTKKEKEFEKLVNTWKTKIPDIVLAPFNNKTWSSF
jgi:hypothetical protein